MGKTRLLETDVKTVEQLLRDPEAYGEDPKAFSRKILEAIYANENGIAATRGVVFALAPGLVLGVGPYPTVDAASKAMRSPEFGEWKGLYPARLVHPNRYRGEQKW